MHAVREKVDKALAWMVIALMGVAVVNVLWQVFSRWVLKDPSSYTEELARYLLIWVGLLGASYAVGKKLHLAIDLLPNRLEGKARHVLDIGIEAFIFFFALLVMLVGGLRLVTLTLKFGQVSAALGLQLGYVYLVIPISGILIMYYSILNIIERILALAGRATVITERDPKAAGGID